MNFAIYVIVILSLTLDFFTVLVCLLNGQMKKMDGWIIIIIIIIIFKEVMDLWPVQFAGSKKLWNFLVFWFSTERF